MSQAQTPPRIGSSCTQDRIVQAAIRLYREIGYRKTTDADIARGASMSPANLYRFYPSRRALVVVVVTELLEEVSEAAASEARCDSSGSERLNAALGAISRMHEDRLANDVRLHELVVGAELANWQASLSHADRLRGVVRSIIAAGQASGEFRLGSPMALACCVLDAMDAYLNPSPIMAAALRPAFNEMLTFCAGALSNAAVSNAVPLHLPGVRPDLRYRLVGRT